MNFKNICTHMLSNSTTRNLSPANNPIPMFTVVLLVIMGRKWRQPKMFYNKNCLNYSTVRKSNTIEPLITLIKHFAKQNGKSTQ